MFGIPIMIIRKTSVFTESVPYKDRIRLHYRDEPISGHEEVLVEVIQHPNCTEAIISECGENFKLQSNVNCLLKSLAKRKSALQSMPKILRKNGHTITNHRHMDTVAVMGANGKKQKVKDQATMHPKGKDTSPF